MASEMSVPTIDRVIELQPARLLDVEGYTYLDKDRSVTLFVPPAPGPISLHTLTGFIGAVEAGLESFDPETVLVQVESYDEVHLLERVSDRYGRRQIFVKVKALPAERKFRFNEYYSQEEFNIALRSMFVQTGGIDDLIAIAGNLAKESEVRQEDDGFSQRVTMKAGVVRVAEKVLQPRVTLQPFRTFSEVEQPSGEFIVRVKHDDNRGNLLALFEADGGFWKQTSMQTVRTWIQNSLAGSQVDGLSGIPVIA